MFCFTLSSSALSMDDLQSLLQPTQAINSSNSNQRDWKCSVQLYKGEQDSMLVLTDSTFPDNSFIRTGTAEWTHLGPGSVALLSKILPSSASTLKLRQSISITGITDCDSYWIGSFSSETLLVITSTRLPFADQVYEGPTYQQLLLQFISSKLK